MNITEANHLNQLLKYLLDPGTRVPEEAARTAAENLVSRANQKLLTGLTPEHVGALWEQRVRGAEGEEGEEAACRLCGCTENAACQGGCAWVPNPLGVDVCTACVHVLAVVYAGLAGGMPVADGEARA
ncbi:hypothetical protein [Nonomuraea sp. NPDC049646]|uniref:hypothetical protein n=1 Tax=unclassified Nonomuraea TaxID=2593643 RepID=UPI0037B2CA2D